MIDFHSAHRQSTWRDRKRKLNDRSEIPSSRGTDVTSMIGRGGSGVFLFFLVLKRVCMAGLYRDRGMRRTITSCGQTQPAVCNQIRKDTPAGEYAEEFVMRRMNKDGLKIRAVTQYTSAISPR